MTFVILAALVIMVVCVDIADVFSHGFSCDAMGIDDVYVGDVQGTVDLSQQNYQLYFSPSKRHFAGFQLYFDDIPAGEDGKLILTIEDAQGKALEIVTLHQYELNRLFRVQTRKPLQKGRIYTLTISAEAFEQATTVPVVSTKETSVTSFQTPMTTSMCALLHSTRYSAPTIHSLSASSATKVKAAEPNRVEVNQAAKSPEVAQNLAVARAEVKPRRIAPSS